MLLQKLLWQWELWIVCGVVGDIIVDVVLVGDDEYVVVVVVVIVVVVVVIDVVIDGVV